MGTAKDHHRNPHDTGTATTQSGGKKHGTATEEPSYGTACRDGTRTIFLREMPAFPLAMDFYRR